MGFLRKYSEQFGGSYNLFITATLKHGLFPLLVYKEDF